MGTFLKQLIRKAYIQFIFPKPAKRFLLQSIQTGPGRHSASNPIGTRLSVLWLAAETWSQPLTST